MSLWYDKKKNEYASDGRNGWIKAYCEKIIADAKEYCLKLCNTLQIAYNECKELLNNHFSGTEGRHKASDVDYSTSQTVKAKIDSEVSSLSGKITTETTNRQNADNALRNSISAETSNRQSADDALRGSISAEVTNRQNADTLLRNSISEESTARTNADALLQNSINAETSARESADTEIRKSVDYIEAVLRSGVIRIHFIDLRDEGCDIQDSFSLSDCVPEEYGSYEMYFVLYPTRSIVDEAELRSVLLYSTYGQIDGNIAYTQYYTDVDGVAYTRCTKNGQLNEWTEWRRSNPDSTNDVYKLNQKITALESRIEALEPPSGSSVAYVRT